MVIQIRQETGWHRSAFRIMSNECLKKARYVLNAQTMAVPHPAFCYNKDFKSRVISLLIAI